MVRIRGKTVVQGSDCLDGESGGWEVGQGGNDARGGDGGVAIGASVDVAGSVS
jgi:hypothetical protein